MKLLSGAQNVCRLLLILICISGSVPAFAQLPVCNRIYMDELDGWDFSSTRKIYNYDPAVAVSASNPTLNTILLPVSASGLTVSEVLGSGSPTLTFYTVKGGTYWYYNPTTSVWVNTGHSTGNSAAVNIAAGGGRIYNLVGGTGQVYKYDGTGTGTLLTTVTSQAGEGPYDLLADCEGNFYVLNGSGTYSSRFLKKFSPAGVLLQTWTVSAPSNYAPSGGFGIIGSNIYTDQVGGTFTYTLRMANGTIGTTSVNIASPYSAILPFNSSSAWGNIVGDLGSCASAVPVLPTITLAPSPAATCIGNPITFTSTITNGGTAPTYQWFVNGVLQTGATGSTFTYTPTNGDVVTAQLTSNAVCATMPTAISPGVTVTVNPTKTNAISGTICQGQTYTWAGMSYTSAGAYVRTFSSSAGCDSVVTLTLTVNPTYNTSFNAGICAGGTYTWAGSSYTAAGSYPHTFTTTKGCDSIVTLNLSVNPSISNTVNASICQGASYLFNGIPRTTAGTYTATFTAAGGCDSIVTLNLTVNPTYNTAFSASICQGTSYTWAGSSYSASGSYPHTFTTTKGCDSVVTLNLTVNPTYNTSFNASTCTGSAYSWAGTSYTTTGSYPHTFTTTKGCDSVVTLNLTVAPPVTNMVNVSICQGGSYLFGGTPRTTAGTYTATFTSAAGCDSVVTLNLTVNPTYNTSFSASICQGQTYTWAGTGYTTAGSYPHTFTTTKGCDSIVTLSLTVNPTYNTSFNAGICQGATYTWAGLTYNATGSYPRTFTTTKGCDSVVTLNLAVHPTFSNSFAASICAGSSYSFGGNTYNTSGSYPHTFTTVNGCDSVVTLVLTVNPTYNTSINASICNGTSYSWAGNTYSTAGSYPHTFTSSKGCDSIVTLNLSLTPAPSSTLTAGFCQGSSYTFGGNTYTAAGTYYIPFTTTGGCDSIVTLNLTEWPAQALSTTVTICQGGSYAFNGTTYNTAGTYAHVFSNSHGCDSTVTLQINVTPAPHTHVYDTTCTGQFIEFLGNQYNSTGIYELTVKNGACDSLVTLHLFVRQIEQPYISLDAEACQNEPTGMAVYHTSMAWNASYYWLFDDAQILNGSGTGPYRMQWQDTGWKKVTFIQIVPGCWDVTATDSIYIHPTPKAKILSNIGAICAMDTVSLTAAYTPGHTYEWFPAAWVASQSGNATADMRVQRSGWVGVTVTSSAGCTGSDSMLIAAENCCVLEMPTAFSPNGDGRNDVFRPISRGNQQIAAFRVVNRWGQVVYESRNQRAGWDGTFGGVPQPMDTYMYYLKYLCADGSAHEKSGDVILIR